MFLMVWLWTLNTLLAVAVRFKRCRYKLHYINININYLVYKFLRSPSIGWRLYLVVWYQLDSQKPEVELVAHAILCPRVTAMLR